MVRDLLIWKREVKAQSWPQVAVNEALFMTKRTRVTVQLERGTALAEMAFLLPILLVLSVGAVDFARAVKTGITLANAAHAGVQYGHQTLGKTGDNVGMEEAAELEAQNLADGISVTSTRFCNCPDGSSVN